MKNTVHKKLYSLSWAIITINKDVRKKTETLTLTPTSSWRKIRYILVFINIQKNK